MRSFLRDLFAVLGRHKRPLLIFIGALCLAVLAIMLVIQTQLQRASFCGSCHFMEPYVRHWEASSHADVTCIKCHDYGTGDVIMSAMKITTGTYTLRPKADVHDQSCLSAGCHNMEDLKQKVEYNRGILFDHTVHLEKPLRGEKLRCSSCHNQMVQYDEEVTPTHMTVNNMACFVCHFKDAGKGESITGCDACHGMPKEPVMHGGFSFDHQPYLKLGVDCKQCHTAIVEGDGAVPESRCYSCHVERSRTSKTREELHAIHVTDNGVDCFKCHTEIKHGNFEMVGALDISCENCHVRMHNGPRQLYMGIGGADTLDMPSPMFIAQVTCTGCHDHMTAEGQEVAKPERKEAQRTSCVTCHGKGFDLMFDNWQTGAPKATEAFAGYIAKSRAALNSGGGSATDKALVRQALDTAELNLRFLKDAHLQHNIFYAVYLMNASADRVDGALKQISGSYTPASRGAAAREASCQNFCHGNTLMPETVTYEGKQLPHLMHAAELELGCQNCHSVTTHGKTEINKEACSACHE